MSDGGYECSECHEVFDTHSALGGHTVSRHSDEDPDEPIECPSCDRSFASRQAVGTHHGKTHGESLREYERRTADTTGKVACPSCDRYLNGRLGVTIHHSRTHDDPEPLQELMIADLKEFANELGRVPKSEDLSNPETDIWTQVCYHNNFGTLQAALKEAGLDERGRYRNIPREDLCDELRRVNGEIDTAVFTSDMDALGKYSYNAYISMFGSWSAACEAAGVPAPTHHGSNNPMWRGGKSISDAVRKCIGSESWYATVSRVRERDERVCQKCGRQAIGQNLDVHHIIPVNSGGCNADELLMALCKECHRTVESFTRSLFDPVLVDWTADELPDGRERWTPDADPGLTGQTELTAFGD